MFNITCSDNFSVTHRVENPCDGVTLIYLDAKTKGEPSKLYLNIKWYTECVGANVFWAPNCYQSKRSRPSWYGTLKSCESSSAPVAGYVSYNDNNALMIACSDAKNEVGIEAGVVEADGQIECAVEINVQYNLTEYSAVVRFDTRKIPFYKVVGDIVKWWEGFDGYKPANVPTSAKMPLYSTWYSYHQDVDVPVILAECKYFADLGCRAVIVDDGWQTDTTGLGYQFCGDWEPAPSKIKDMKAFVDGIHALGMKFLLWYSVPFVGIKSKVYERFKNMLLPASDVNGDTFKFDPRFPEVREYLIGKYKKAVLDWGLDGFKLDFIDSFSQCDEVRDGMDCVSVYDGVDRLFKEILSELRKLNPDIMIEFRQSYIGPLMRTFGNMFRVVDCPNDSFENRRSSLNLRISSGNTAIHSDMLMWDPRETAEQAAYQLTHIAFAVPQISVKAADMPERHAKMVKTYLSFWTENRDVLMEGEMFYKGYASDFLYASSRKDGAQIGVVFAGRIAYLEHADENITIINANPSEYVAFDSKFSGKYKYTVENCVGEQVSCGEIDIKAGEISTIAAPENGYINMKRI